MVLDCIEYLSEVRGRRRVREMHVNWTTKRGDSRHELVFDEQCHGLKVLNPLEGGKVIPDRNGPDFFSEEVLLV